MPIARLDPHLVNQIAAGEVVERPASVVKELIENCIDAGATRIGITVEEGGAKLIRIADDGCGIPEGELELALTAHATSKLATARELAAIDTLGFRGEALASIASVSRVRLSSRTHAAEGGAEVTQNGDERTVVRPAAMAPGTVIEVKDLFWNVPARRKFLRSGAAEYGQIADTVNRAAMANPDVGYTLSHNGRKTLSLPPGQSRRARCVAVLGKDLDDALIEFFFEGRGGDGGDGGDEPAAEPPRVWGVAGEPSVARATSKFLHVYINGRPVKDRSLNHAVKEAYRGLMAGDRHPVAAVFIQMDPRLVDVNVHPTKAEVRFREPRMMHGLVRAPLRERLLASDVTPAGAPAAQALGPSPGEPVAGPAGGPSAGASHGVTARGDTRAWGAAGPSVVSGQKGFVYDQVKRAMAADGLLVREGPPRGGAPPRVAGVPGSAAPARMLQVHNSYVIVEDPDGVLIIDQHALHERVMFEAIQARILGREVGDSAGGPGDLESQRMLMPVVIGADAARMALLEDAAPLLGRLGIEAAAMGPAAIGIHAFPSLLLSRGVEPAAFVDGLLGKVEEGELSGAADALESEAALHKVLDMMSCKAAVKAGDQLTDAELAALLETRERVERSGSCPHGRPTTVRISLRELEKLFHR